MQDPPHDIYMIMMAPLFYRYNACLPVFFLLLVSEKIEPLAGFAAAQQRRKNNAISSNEDDKKGFGTSMCSSSSRANNSACATTRKKQQREQDVSTIKSSSGYTPDTSEKTLRFMDFLYAKECEGIEALEIGFDKQTGLRGIFCKKPIGAGEFICAIPFVSTLLVNEVYDPIEEEEAAAETTTPYSPGNILSASRLENGLHFLQRFWKNEEQYQQWKPYFACLPRDKNDPNFDPTPDFWSPEEIRQLQIPSLVDQILARKQGLEVLARGDHNTVSLKELQHAAWLIQTRAFTTFQKVVLKPNNDNERLLRSRTVLIPYLDFINHSSAGDDKTNAELQVVETKEYDESFYALQATRNIQAGKEIRICYGTGQETFLDLYSKYGFLLVPSRKKDWQRLQKNGLETCFTTALEEDEQELATTPRGSTRARILETRIHVKRLLEKQTKRGKE